MLILILIFHSDMVLSLEACGEDEGDENSCKDHGRCTPGNKVKPHYSSLPRKYKGNYNSENGRECRTFHPLLTRPSSPDPMRMLRGQLRTLMASGARHNGQTALLQSICQDEASWLHS